MSDDWPPLIVAVAPTGARKSKGDHPALPITPSEIAAAAAACRDAGAAMIHLHVRDRDGRHSLDAGAYRTAIAAVRRAAGDGMIIQVTSESVGRYGPEEQMAMVRDVRPEAVSLALREIIPDAEHERGAAAFLAWLVGERIVPQYIVYSAAEVERYRALAARGIIPGKRHFLLFVLGRYAADQTSAPRELLPFLAVHNGAASGGAAPGRAAPGGAAPGGAAPGGASPWAVCAFGPREGACGLVAAALGGHVRVGFANNTRLSGGSVAPDNAALVAQARAGAALLGRELADAQTARNMLWGLFD